MSLLVALAPNMEVSAQEFADAWNADGRFANTASVTGEQAGARSFDGGLAADTVKLAVEIATGVASGTIIEIVKALWESKQGEPKSRKRKVQVIEASRPDGSRILAVTVEEE